MQEINLSTLTKISGGQAKAQCHVEPHPPGHVDNELMTFFNAEKVKYNYRATSSTGGCHVGAAHGEGRAIDVADVNANTIRGLMEDARAWNLTHERKILIVNELQDTHKSGWSGAHAHIQISPAPAPAK